MVGNREKGAGEKDEAADDAEAVAAVYDRRNDGGNGDSAEIDSGKSAPPQEDTGVASFDESMESAFLAEARERGEKVPVRKRDAADDATEAGSLPALDELVQRIPAETRELLDDLFRAKFTTVRRVPAKALKT